ncbi:MAG: NfeD family protein [Eubacteriales bacterium]|nr:NfeD family protein [Eubacteriales bacterium]
MEFIAENISIIISLLVATVLLIIEMYMPGVGVPGVSGVVFMLIGVFIAWRQHGALAGLGVLLIAIALVSLAVIIAMRSTAKGRMSKSSLILRSSSTKEEGYSASEDKTALVGKEGISLTVLRPSGIAHVDGKRIDVVTGGEFIPKGIKIKVKKAEGARLLVERVEEDKNV